MTITAKYVGSKPQEMDCVAGTGLVWEGLGDEHEVSVEAAAILARHPDVWELIAADGPNEPTSEAAGLGDVAPVKKNKGGRPRKSG